MTREYPITETHALLIDPYMAAYINLYYDRKANTVPAEIQNLLDTNAFDLAVRSGGIERICDDYTDIEYAVDRIFDNNNNGEVGMTFCTQFYGEAETASDIDANTRLHQAYEDDYIAYLMPNNGADLFKPAYSSLDELIQEFKSRIGHMLPDDMDYHSHICSINGTYCA